MLQRARSTQEGVYYRANELLESRQAEIINLTPRIVVFRSQDRKNIIFLGLGSHKEIVISPVADELPLSSQDEKRFLQLMGLLGLKGGYFGLATEVEETTLEVPAGFDSDLSLIELVSKAIKYHGESWGLKASTHSRTATMMVKAIIRCNESQFIIGDYKTGRYFSPEFWKIVKNAEDVVEFTDALESERFNAARVSLNALNILKFIQENRSTIESYE